ncbi:MAG: D-TA family PLP-dependent enzyme [Bryobacteraceae bacterium]
MDLSLASYAIEDPDRIITPALLIYPELVDSNIKATLRMLGNDANRWRPHIKTAKLTATLQQLIENGIQSFKCSTTLELLTACKAGARDVLLAYSVMGANARRTIEIANQFPSTRVSVLIETVDQAAIWTGSGIGVFLDINSGMNRTGMNPDRVREIIALARRLGGQFRGVHYYDGHVSGFEISERKARAHEGYEQLLKIVNALQEQKIKVGEVITSGTPAAPFALSFEGFRNASFVHRVSPGTVVYNDTTSLDQLPDYGYQPAAIVLSTVVSRPASNYMTCDAGHKSVSADAGIPTCSVIGHPQLRPSKPSEEHLPLECLPGGRAPNIGDKIYLVPRHVCPTVNNFDEALLVIKGRVRGIEPVSARGHESPLAQGANWLSLTTPLEGEIRHTGMMSESRPVTELKEVDGREGDEEPGILDPNDSNLLRDQIKGQTTEHATPPRLEDEGQSGG